MSSIRPTLQLMIIIFCTQVQNSVMNSLRSDLTRFKPSVTQLMFLLHFRHFHFKKGATFYSLFTFLFFSVYLELPLSTKSSFFFLSIFLWKLCATDSGTRFGDLLDFGQLLKPQAPINLPKSLIFLGNLYQGVKIYHFSSEIIFVQLLQTFGNFFLVTLAYTSFISFH